MNFNLLTPQSFIGLLNQLSGWLGQFRDTSTQVVLTPNEYASGKVVYPYGDAKK